MGSSQDRQQGLWTAPLSERAMAVLGAACLLGLLGFLLWQAVAGKQGPPDIVVEVKQVVAVEAGWLLSFRARNRGGETAANAVIRGELRNGENVLESASLTIDYVPPSSVREGGLYFRRDPRRHQLILEPVGYATP